MILSARERFSRSRVGRRCTGQGAQDEGLPPIDTYISAPWGAVIFRRAGCMHGEVPIGYLRSTTYCYRVGQKYCGRIMTLLRVFYCVNVAVMTFFDASVEA